MPKCGFFGGCRYCIIMSATCIICLGDDPGVGPLECACRGTSGIHAACRTRYIQETSDSREDVARLCKNRELADSITATVLCRVCKRRVALRPVVESDLQVLWRLGAAQARRLLVAIVCTLLPAQAVARWSAGVAPPDPCYIGTLVRLALVARIYSVQPVHSRWNLLACHLLQMLAVLVASLAESAVAGFVGTEWPMSLLAIDLFVFVIVAVVFTGTALFVWDAISRAIHENRELLRWEPVAPKRRSPQTRTH